MTELALTARRRRRIVVVLSPAARLDCDSARAPEAELSAIAGCGRCAAPDRAGIVDFVPAGPRTLLTGAVACQREGNEPVLAAFQSGCGAVLEADGLWPAPKCHESVDAALDACALGGPGDGAAIRKNRGGLSRAHMLPLEGFPDAGSDPGSR